MAQLMDVLGQFEIVEANLSKLERLWRELEDLLGTSISIGRNSEYEDRARSFVAVRDALPAIDGWRLEASPPDPESVSRTRFELMELDEPYDQAAFESGLWADGREIEQFRFRFDRKRRALIRDRLVEIIGDFDLTLQAIRREVGDLEPGEKLGGYPSWTRLRDHVAEIEVLLGSSVATPPGWANLRRHLHFAQAADLTDIEANDWPHAKQALRKGLYGTNEPLPVQTRDIGELVASKPVGPVTMRLAWDNLDDDGFEGLVFALIADEKGYENPQWLMRTRAPDRGRDLSVDRVTTDALAGTLRERVVIQCKHWLSRSVDLASVSMAKSRGQNLCWRVGLG